MAAKRFEESARHKAVNPQRAEGSFVEAGYAYISQYWKTGDAKFLAKAVNILTPVKVKPVTESGAIRSRLALGEIYIIQGTCELAAAEYQAVLDMQPKDAYSLGVAQFELGCALYGQGDWAGAEKAFDTFLKAREGQTLTQKDSHWKTNRPGYTGLLTVAPDKAKLLTGLELVSTAAYWRGAALCKLGRFAEAKPLISDLLSTFKSSAITERARDLNAQYASIMEDVK